MFKVNNKTPEQRTWHRFGDFIVNFFLLLLLTYFTPFSTTVDFEQVNIRWDEISNYL